MRIYKRGGQDGSNMKQDVKLEPTHQLHGKQIYLRPVLGRPLFPLFEVRGLSSFMSDCRMLSSV